MQAQVVGPMFVSVGAGSLDALPGLSGMVGGMLLVHLLSVGSKPAACEPPLG